MYPPILNKNKGRGKNNGRICSKDIGVVKEATEVINDTSSRKTINQFNLMRYNT